MGPSLGRSRGWQVACPGELPQPPAAARGGPCLVARFWCQPVQQQLLGCSLRLPALPLQQALALAGGALRRVGPSAGPQHGARGPARQRWARHQARRARPPTRLRAWPCAPLKRRHQGQAPPRASSSPASTINEEGGIAVVRAHVRACTSGAATRAALDPTSPCWAPLRSLCCVRHPSSAAAAPRRSMMAARKSRRWPAPACGATHPG